MDINLSIDNFLDTILEDEIKFEDANEKTVLGKEKTILGMCFYQSLKKKIYPADFESNISLGSIKIYPLDKPEISNDIESDYRFKDGWLTLKHTLNEKQILHYILLYRLSYLQHCYPEQFNRIKDIPPSKNMNEYFNKTKEELQDEYNKVKVNQGAN
jgi:hypothetical protein